MINKEKSISSTAIVDKKFIFPFILVTSLFALWGFANAVTDPMVNAFKKVLELSNSEAAWVQMAFYGGYFSMALPASVVPVPTCATACKQAKIQHVPA